jgi:Nitronate monooxygenase
MATLAEAQPRASSQSLVARERATRFCRRFGLRVPILQAPMAGACPTSLASAVANAGGLGGLGALTTPPDGIASWAREFRDQSNGGFQINLWIPDPPPVRDAEHEGQVREFLRQWGPPVPAEAGDACRSTLPHNATRCSPPHRRSSPRSWGCFQRNSSPKSRRAISPGLPARRRSPKPALPRPRAPTPSSHKVRRQAATAARSMPLRPRVNPLGSSLLCRGWRTNCPYRSSRPAGLVTGGALPRP